MIKKFSVEGMTCSACSSGIERKVSKLKGVNSVVVSLLAKEMTVDFDDKILSVGEIVRTVEKIGYRLDESGKPRDRFEEAKKLKKRFFVSLIFLIPLLYFSMGGMVGLPVFDNKINFIIQFVFATSIIIINFKFYKNGVKALFNLSPNMDTLVSLGSVSAYVYSIVVTITLFFGRTVHHTFFEASAMVLTLVTLGKWLEELSKVKTGDAIDKLNKFLPKTATILKDGKMVTVLTSEIEVGDTIILRGGDYVPIDGVVVEGTANIDKSAITGESLPEEVKVDDFISSGSIIKDGFLMVDAIQVGEDTMFSKIVEIVKHAGSSKAPVQRIADKVSGIFVPIVTLIAITTFVLWLSFTGDLFNSFNYGISVLVISCPCALGLATPVAVMASTGLGATKGILYKDAGTMQNACKINCVLLDKTATITVGEPKVTEFVNLSTLSNQTIYSFVGALESKSTHPLAQSVVDFCGQSKEKVDEFNYVIGAGINGVIQGKQYYLGNRKLIPESITKSKDFTYEQEYFGKTVLYFSDDEKLLAIFVVADYIKDDSKEAIEKLKKLGIKTVMITGDNLSVATRVAKEVGIDEFEAQVLPQDKYAIVEKYKSEGYYVAMVGDGINDSPALKSSDVGIAMGTGTDIAIDSSDIIIANGSLNGVSNAIAISKKSNRIIKQNLFWAFIYNVIAIPIAAGVFSFVGFSFTPMVASVCMSFSSLFVVGNALRISRKEKKNTKKKQLKAEYYYLLKIEGMMCGHCTSKVEESLIKIDGVLDVSTNLKEKSATVSSAKIVTDIEFKSNIEQAGYTLLNVEKVKK